MKKIIIIAYQCSPYRGSEYSVAWNHIINMSEDNNLTVIYGTSGDHMGNFDDMNSYLEKKQFDKVKFIPIVPSVIANALNILNKKDIFNYSFYFAYRAWQKQVYNYVKELIKIEHFDLIHFLGPIGYREPGYLWKLDIPYIWGPICGVNNVPRQLLNITSTKGKLRFYIRNIVNSLQFKYSRRLRKALEGVDLLLTATTETQEKFKIYHHKDSIYIPENAILEEPQLCVEKFSNSNHKYKIVFVGRLDDGKACILLLKALTFIKNRNLIQVDIIGDGPLKGKLEKYVIDNNLDDIVTFCGKLPRTEVLQKYKEAHLHVITSLSEANTTVIWEAMTNGVPTLSLDHCGMHDTICPKCGIKIPVTNSDQIVTDIAKEIDGLLENPHMFEKLAHGTIECAKKHMWEERAKRMNQYYDIAIERHKQQK